MEPVYLLQVGKEVKAEEEAAVVSVGGFVMVSFLEETCMDCGNVRWDMKLAQHCGEMVNYTM